MDEPSPPDAERLRAICARFNAAPFYRLLGMEAGSDRPGASRVRLPYSERLTQLYGGVHGGALLALADAAISIAVATTFTDEEANATVDVSMQFLAPAGPNAVLAEGTLHKRGKSMAFASAVLTAGGREVARAQGVCHIGRLAKIARPDRLPGLQGDPDDA